VEAQRLELINSPASRPEIIVNLFFTKIPHYSNRRPWPLYKTHFFGSLPRDEANIGPFIVSELRSGGEVEKQLFLWEEQSKWLSLTVVELMLFLFVKKITNNRLY
jgi:hypothetical protein